MDDQGRGSAWEKAGMAIYRGGLRCLPRWLRGRAGEAMLATFRERQRECLEGRGAKGLPGVWLRELTGLVTTALSARLSGRSTPGGTASHAGPPVRRLHRGGSVVDALAQDVRFALRTMARRPLAMTLAVLSFGLGVGASTAMLSVVDVLLLRDLPYPEAGKVVAVYPTLPSFRDIPELADSWQRGRFSPVELEELRREQTSFEALGGLAQRRITLLGDDVPPEDVVGLAVTPELFDVLGIGAALGRTFTEDDLAGPARVILSNGLWERRFGADAEVVGRTLRDGDTHRTIVGVMPRGFSIPGRDADLFVPFDLAGAPPVRNQHDMDALGRLAEGVTVARAEEEASAILTRNLPDAEHARHAAFLAPLQDDLARAARTPALVLTAASLVLLLVACGNVAAIVLGVGIDREAELGVRRALGAGRRRIVGQLMGEGLVLAAAGAAVALGLASLGVDLLVQLAPAGFPGLDDVGVDGRVVLIGLALATLGALVAGLVPAAALSDTDVGTALRSGRQASPRAGRLQTVVVVGELALATVLLAVAGLLGRTFLALNRLDPGFDTEEVVAVDVSVGLHFGRLLAEDRERAGERLRLFVERVVEALEGVPGVERVAATTDIPLGTGRANNRVWPGDRDMPEEDRPVAQRRAVTPGYFETLGVRLVQGRGLREADAATGDSVAVVSEGLARALWPSGPALGRPLTFYSGTYRVVGVAENIRDEGLESPSKLAFYVPMRQSSSTPHSFLVRVSGNPRPLVPALRNAVWSAEPDVPVTTARPLADFRGDRVAEERYRARLMAVFSLLAVLFALMGVYGVTARQVARRRREIGIRLALGSAAVGVHALILRQSLRMGMVGVALGLALSLVLARSVESLLFGVAAADPLTLAGISGFLLLGVAATTLEPSRRAARTDPAEVLRGE